MFDTVEEKLALELLPLLETNKQILGLIKKAEATHKVRKLATSLLKLQGKTEAELLAIMKEANCIHEVCGVVIPLLRLEEKTDDELLAVAKEMDYHWRICRIITPVLKEKDSIFLLLKKVDYDPVFCAVSVQALKKLKAKN